jgi:hypothetical protein
LVHWHHNACSAGYKVRGFSLPKQIEKMTFELEVIIFFNYNKKLV